MKVLHSVSVKGGIYPYSIELQNMEGDPVFFVTCPDAGIAQPFYPEDIAQLLVDLPQWITEYQQGKSTREEEVPFFTEGHFLRGSVPAL